MQQCGMFDWDDLRVYIAAARGGSFSAAAKRIGVDTATVGRRVTRLETALKSTLLVRSATGLQLTAAGAQLLDIALRAEATMEDAARVTQPDLVAGTVRISASEGFGTLVLAPAMPALAEQRPGLRIELAANAGFLSPSRREVDMAVTLSAPQAQRLVAEPLTHYQLALYAAPSYLSRRGEPQSLSDLMSHQIVGYVEDLIYASELRYLQEVSPGLTPTLASSSIRGQHAIVSAGGGLGVLPCFMAQDLVRVLPTTILIERRFWLSTHQDVHGTARVRSVRAWMQGVVAEAKPRLLPF